MKPFFRALLWVFLIAVPPYSTLCTAILVEEPMTDELKQDAPLESSDTPEAVSTIKEKEVISRKKHAAMALGKVATVGLHAVALGTLYYLRNWEQNKRNMNNKKFLYTSTDCIFDVLNGLYCGLALYEVYNNGKSAFESVKLASKKVEKQADTSKDASQEKPEEKTDEIQEDKDEVKEGKKETSAKESAREPQELSIKQHCVRALAKCTLIGAGTCIICLSGLLGLRIKDNLRNPRLTVKQKKEAKLTMAGLGMIAATGVYSAVKWGHSAYQSFKMAYIKIQEQNRAKEPVKSIIISPEDAELMTKNSISQEEPVSEGNLVTLQHARATIEK